MKTTVSPTKLLKSQTPDVDEVVIWRHYRSMTKRERTAVRERIRAIADPILRNRASKLIDATYVI